MGDAQWFEFEFCGASRGSKVSFGCDETGLSQGVRVVDGDGIKAGNIRWRSRNVGSARLRAGDEVQVRCDWMTEVYGSGRKGKE